VRKILERIAKEGRKYGVSLGLITQRPSDLAEGVLSQCGTIIAMRLNNDRDQAFVKAAMPKARAASSIRIPALRNREAIICGEGVAIPIRVALDDLEARSARPPTIRSSPNCGASPAARRRCWNGSSSAGAIRGGTRIKTTSFPRKRESRCLYR
jgi:DNA helicase HerA-like ATPase